MRYWRRFEAYLSHRNLIRQPPTLDELFYFVYSSSTSNATRMVMMEALRRQLTLLRIPVPQPDLLKLIIRGLRNMGRLLATPISYEPEHVELLRTKAKNAVRGSPATVKVWLILMLMLSRYMRPDDVSKIEKKTIKLTRDKLLFRMKWTKEVQLRRTQSAYSAFIVSKDKILMDLMRKHLQYTTDHIFLFQHFKKISPLSAQRLSSLIRPLFRKLELPYMAKHLRKIGSTHSLFTRQEDLEELMSQGRWSNVDTWRRHYALSKSK